jgi:Spy/CpxP family protein refolding chaperone
MKKIVFSIVIILLVSWNFSFAAERNMFFGHKFPGMKWWKMPKISEKLNLTKSQKEELNDLYVQSKRKLIDIKSKLEKERFELEQLMESEKLNESSCMDQFTKIIELRSKIGTERFKFILQVRKLLGSEKFQIVKTEFHSFKRHHMRPHKDGNKLYR